MDLSKQGIGQIEGGNENVDNTDSPAFAGEIKYSKPPCLSTRTRVALMICLGFIISFGMRCNLSMAKMSIDNEKNFINGNYESEKVWTTDMESAIDSSFFWGYLVTQIPGGYLTSYFPANRVFGAAIFVSSICNLLIPLSISISPYMLIMVRIFQGLAEGVTYPACHGIWRFWAPPLERSRLPTIAFGGSYIGVLIGLPVSGILANLNWRAPFYFYSTIGIVWCAMWLSLFVEKPRLHPTIASSELKYIEKSLGESVHQPTSTIPWKDMVRSKPVIAIVVANFCRSWTFYMLVLYQSSYLKHVFSFDTSEAGLVSALPLLLLAIIVPFGGMLADFLRKSGTMTTTNVRKLFNCGGLGLQGFFFLLVAYSDTAGKALIALTIGAAFSGFASSGYNVNHLDIAPRYASILIGLSNGIGTIAGLICPIVIDQITQDPTPSNWSFAFKIAACIHLFGITFYGIFASGELQYWAEPPVNDKSQPSLIRVDMTKETASNEPQGDTSLHALNNPYTQVSSMLKETVQPEA